MILRAYGMQRLGHHCRLLLPEAPATRVTHRNEQAIEDLQGWYNFYNYYYLSRHRDLRSSYDDHLWACTVLYGGDDEADLQVAYWRSRPYWHWRIDLDLFYSERAYGTCNCNILAKNKLENECGWYDMTRDPRLRSLATPYYKEKETKWEADEAYHLQAQEGPEKF